MKQRGPGWWGWPTGSSRWTPCRWTNGTCRWTASSPKTACSADSGRAWGAAAFVCVVCGLFLEAVVEEGEDFLLQPDVVEVDQPVAAGVGQFSDSQTYLY